MAGTVSQSRLEATVRDAVALVVDAAGVDLIDVEIKGPPNRRVVRVIADADGGLDIDRIAELSRDVSNVLDDADIVNGSWTLEVSSPGVDRPLTTDRDFARQVGRDVRLALPEGDDVVGTLRAVTEGVLVLDVDGTEMNVAITDVDHGRVELPW